MLTLFTSPTCGPCRILKPELRELCAELELPLAERDISKPEDKEAALAAGVRGVPAVVHNGKVLFIGYLARPAVVDAFQKAGLL